MMEFNAKNLYEFYFQKREEDWFAKKDMGALILQISGTHHSPYIVMYQPENEFVDLHDYESLLALSEQMGEPCGFEFEADFETEYAEIEDRGKLDKMLKEFGEMFGYDQIRWFPDSDIVWIGRKDCLTSGVSGSEIEEVILKDLITIPEMQIIEVIKTIIIHTDDQEVTLFINPTDIDKPSSWKDTLEVPFFFSHSKTGFLEDGDARIFYYWLKMAAYIEQKISENTDINSAADFKVFVVQHDDLLDERWRDVALANAELSLEEFVEKMIGQTEEY